MSNAQIQTIEDLLRAAYGNPYGPPAILTGDFASMKQVAKADAPALTTSTNFFNNVYGAAVFRALNSTVNAWGALPKGVFKKTGTTVASAYGGSAADGGTSEGATLPDSTIPTLQRYAGKPKEVVHKFQVSTKQEFLHTQADDDTAMGMDSMRMEFEQKHATALDEQILVDNQTAASSNFESLDRIISSNAEVVSLSLTANSCDIWGLNRDASGFSDAYVDDNAGTDRVYSDDLIRSLQANIREAGGRTTFYLTGPDTLMDIVGTYQAHVTYNPVGQTMAQGSVNGINTDKGLDMGQLISTLYGTALIEDFNVATDTKSRIYAVDARDNPKAGEPNLYLKMAIPTLYFETGPQVDNDLFKTAALLNQGAFYTAGEIWCNVFKFQGKIRDLK